MGNELIIVDTIKSTMKLIYWVKVIVVPGNETVEKTTIEVPCIKQNKYLNKETLYYLDILSTILEKIHKLNIDDILNELETLIIPKKLKPKIRNITSNCLNNRLKYKLYRIIDNKTIKIIELKEKYKENNVYCNIIEKQLIDFKKELRLIEKIKVYEIIFKDTTLSYMEQMNIAPKIVFFLKDLRQQKGIGFKEYVDKWSDRLIKEYFVST